MMISLALDYRVSRGKCVDMYLTDTSRDIESSIISHDIEIVSEIPLSHQVPHAVERLSLGGHILFPRPNRQTISYFLTK